MVNPVDKLLIATNNPGKIRELHELLDDTGFALVTPAQINLDLDVIEDGITYAENATKKAIAFAKESGLISLADDSGLEVDALNGEPGLYSARYGSTNGEKLSDKGRRQFLVKNLQGKPRPWTARFHATIAIATPANVALNEATLASDASAGESLEDNKAETLPGTDQPGRCRSLHSLRVTDIDVYLAEGWCEGQIIPEERGTGGFGYDPIFLLPELGRTMAELTREEKNHLSHRARAVMNAKGILQRLFSK
jgi:XTP/dITP diphosphohydrolase